MHSNTIAVYISCKIKERGTTRPTRSRPMLSYSQPGSYLRHRVYCNNKIPIFLLITCFIHYKIHYCIGTEMLGISTNLEINYESAHSHITIAITNHTSAELLVTYYLSENAVTTKYLVSTCTQHNTAAVTDSQMTKRWWRILL